MGEALEGFAIVGPDSGFALVDVEAVVMPAEELVGLTLGNPLEFQQALDHAVPEDLSELLTAGAAYEVELVRVIENSGGGETVDVGVIGEVVSEGMYGEDDAGATVWDGGLLAQPILQGVGDEVAELGEALRIFTENVTQDSRDGEDPMAVRDGEADFVANIGGSIECTPLVATRAAAASLTGEGKQVVVIAVGALHAKEAAGEVATAQAVAQGGLTGGIERAEVFEALRVIPRGEGFERVVEALPERRAAGMARPVVMCHAPLYMKICSLIEALVIHIRFTSHPW